MEAQKKIDNGFRSSRVNIFILMQTMYVCISETIGNRFLYILFLVKFGYWYFKVSASFSIAAKMESL